jgi:tripartite-type tricarboxylate transporter receptor subunit TctC
MSYDMTRASRSLSIVIALGAGSLLASCAFAAYPEKPIRVVLPYPPGGGGDITIRILQPLLEKRLGQPLVVDYRAGAAGNIGTREVVNAVPDGYTLLLGATNNFVINQFLYPQLGFDPLQALSPVAMLTDIPYVVFINASVPAQTFAEFASFARAHPGRLNYGSPGNATIPHLSAFMLSEALGAAMVHIPYRGSQPGVQALLANDVQMFVISYGIAGTYLASGKLRALVVAAPQRLKVLPSVPTISEAGIPPEVIPSNWWALAAPKGTDSVIIDRLSREIRGVLADAEIQKKYADQGAIPIGSSPAELSEQMLHEAQTWKAIVAKSGVTADN